MHPTTPPYRLRADVICISHALALLFVAAPCFAQSQSQATVNLGAVVITGKVPGTFDPTETAPSQGSLDARSALSVVSDSTIRNFTAPISDYTQALTMTPGVFAYTANGVGLGDAKVTMRGLPDSNMVLSFDGIPFNDTNGVSHHSWVFFPSQFLGGAVVDRGPGSAATIGQATFGGNVDLRSRLLEPEARTSVTGSVGSWNTRLLGIERQTGPFGQEGKSSLLFNAQKMKSDGYEIYNVQDRAALSVKYQYAANSDTMVTLFGSKLNLKNNTPNIKGITRANYNAGDYVDMLSADPKLGNFYGYNFYNIDTDFEYAGISTMLGGGWKLEDKLYRYNYHNKQNYANSAAALPALPNLSVAGTDKLNSYITMGNVLRLSQESALGTLRTGLWIDQAKSYRYQTPTNPQTWVDVAVPNFTETYTTTTLQPYLEYEFKIGDKLKVTPGVKYASYKQEFVHLQDNGGAVGALGGTYPANGVINKVNTTVVGGAASLANSVTYTDALPSLDLHYNIQPNWTAYAQYALGDQIPSTSVFDVKNALVSPVPKATKATTAQFGTVWNSGSYTFAGDVYHTKLDGAYTALPPDSLGNVGYVLSGTQVNQGIEAEANMVLGSGFSLYVNGTIGNLKYSNGQWVAGAPENTQTFAVNYENDRWAVSMSVNRVGKMYGDDKAGVHEAFTIDPVVLANLFVNYTIKTPGSFARQTKLQFGANNLFNSHGIVGIASPVAGSSSAAPNAADLLTVMPGRSLSATATIDF